MPIITVTIFSAYKIGPVNTQRIFKLLFLVKGLSLCNLETKVMEYLEILVVCGYGGAEYLNQNSYIKHSTCKDGCLVCFPDIW